MRGAGVESGTIRHVGIDFLHNLLAGDTESADWGMLLLQSALIHRLGED